MIESTLTSNRPDVRILTLKRWNFPQTDRLFPSDGSGPAAEGEYISYNSHHFIRIEHCAQTKEPPIRWAYSNLENLRRKQRDEKKLDIHMVQSLTLLGEEGDFWDLPGNVLYISFLQLTNDAVTTMEDIKKAIEPIMKNRAPDAIWTLYYSLDFCDMVLFAKNLSYQSCSYVLRDMSIVRGDALSILRDTFTISGFRQEFLRDAFQKLNCNKVPQWEDRASLSIQLSIQSYKVWIKFEEMLKDSRIPFHAWRSFGRYDIHLRTEEISGVQILKLLHLLDAMAGESKDRAFGGYEVALEAPWNGIILGEPTDAEQNRNLEKSATKVMNQLCELCAHADPDSVDYIDETRRSLVALLKNGFSEEFVLSVLPSFLGYLQISIDIKDYRDRISLKKEAGLLLKESQGKMTRHYFNALNMLALCTMHSERQFIQAPAFNAIFFDVPPKLLAFYSAIAREILDTLRSENDKDYHFLFVPNYQKDINVRPLELRMEEDLPQHLAVVHLRESYFYDPTLTIKLFCHEAAHYLSDRHREERARYVFRAVSFFLLANTPLVSVDKTAEDDGILAVMADSLADFMVEKFEEQISNPTRGIPFQLQDVSDFLADNTYGIAFFASASDTNEICSRWVNALRTHVCLDPNGFGEFFENGLKRILETLHSDYLVELFHQDREGMYVYDVFSQFIAHCAQFLHGSPMDTSFDSICEDILQAFSEAYADLRMSELIGRHFSVQEYEHMFQEVDVVHHYQMLLRHDAVLKTVELSNGGWEAWIPTDKKFLPIVYASEQIHKYLLICHNVSATSDLIPQVLDVFQGKDVSKQWDCIRTTIQNYHNYLTQYCQRIARVYPLVKS